MARQFLCWQHICFFYLKLFVIAKKVPPEVASKTKDKFDLLLFVFLRWRCQLGGKPVTPRVSWVAGWLVSNWRGKSQSEQVGFHLVRAQDGSESVGPADGRIAGESGRLLCTKPFSKIDSHWVNTIIVLGWAVFLLLSIYVTIPCVLVTDTEMIRYQEKY